MIHFMKNIHIVGLINTNSFFRLKSTYLNLRRIKIMATAKKDAAKTTAKKVEVKPVETKTTAKTTKKDDVKAPVKTVAKKETVKVTEKKEETKVTPKAPAKKAETKTTTKKAETKTTAKTTAKKSTAKKENNLFVQFHGMEFDAKAIEKAVKEDYKAKNGKKTMNSVSIYVKPEDMKAYYVIDGIIGDVAL